MRAHHVHIEHRFEKPPERIFAYLAEHENLSDLFDAKITRLRDGEGARNGVGSVRRLKPGPLPAFEETVTVYEEFTRIEYRITKGSPLNDHLGVMTFAPDGEGTRFVYDIRLGSAIPGLAGIVKASLTRQITKALPKVERES